MRIKSLTLEHFGHFDHWSEDVPAGFSLWVGDNESGKSTLLDAVQLVFYGSAKGGNDPRENIRKRYVTSARQGAVGVVIFEEQGRTYRLLRRFGASNARDHLELYDELTGEVIPLGAKETPGERFFGLDANAFKRSVFVGASGSQLPAIKNQEDQLLARLTNLGTSGEEDVSARTVEARLEKAQKYYIKKNHGGALPALEEDIARLETEKQNALAREAERQAAFTALSRDQEAWDTRRESHRKEKEKHADIAARLDVQRYVDVQRARQRRAVAEAEEKQARRDLALETGELSSERLQEARQAWVRVQQAARREKQLVAEREAMHLPDEPETTDVVQERDALETERQTLSDRQVDLARREAALDTEAVQAKERRATLQSWREQLEADADALRPQGPRWNRSIPLVCFVIGVVSLLFSQRNIGFLVIGVAWIGAAIAVRARLKRESEQAEMQEAKRALERKVQWETIRRQEEEIAPERLDARKRALAQEAERLREAEEDWAKRQTLFEEKERDRHEITRRRREVELLREAKAHQIALSEEEQEKAKETWHNATGCTFVSEEQAQALLREGEERLEAWHKASGALEAAQRALSEVPREIQVLDDEAIATRIAEAGGALTEEETEALRSEARRLATAWEAEDAVLRAQEAELWRRRATLTTQSEGQRLADEIDVELTEKKRRHAQMTFEVEALDAAKDALKEAEQMAQQNFSPRLNARASEIFEALTGRARRLRVDTQFNMTMENETHSLQDWMTLSTGTVEQAYLSLRIAMSELASDGKVLPLLLDDPFVFYDDGRAARGMAFFRDYSAQTGRQVMLFTSHHRLKDSMPSDAVRTIEVENSDQEGVI